jgi:hypothetical protein
MNRVEEGAGEAERQGRNGRREAGTDQDKRRGILGSRLCPYLL